MPVYQVLNALGETCYTTCMIILQANKIERSFAGEVLFDNINCRLMNEIGLLLLGKMVQVSLLF